MKDQAAQTKRVTSPTLSVETRSDMAGVADLWRVFQKTAIGGPHDTWEWNDAWTSTVGRRVLPHIVIGRDDAGEVVFILPFTIRTRMGCKVLEWLASEQGNYASGLFHPTAWQDASMPRGQALLNLVLDALPTVDAVHLDKQPAAIGTFTNPLAELSGVPEASPGHSVPLSKDWEAVFEQQFSADARSKLRRSERRLGEEGNISYELVRDPAEKVRIFDRVIAQKSVYFKERGIHDFFKDQGMRAFFHCLARLPESNPDLSMRVMVCILDGELVASKIGLVHKNIYYGTIASTTEAPLRKHGPGNILFKRSVQFLADEGIEILDCGAGEDQIKLRWCTDERPRLHSIVPVTSKGYAYAAVLTASLRTKLLIKRNPQLFVRYKRMRKWIGAAARPRTAQSRAQTNSAAGVQA